MIKLSIIIPVYNIKEYISRCVESIIRQKTKLDYEIILVDDGSTDGSQNICDDYVFHNEKIRVIHQENGGLCRARNAGVEAAQGEYVVFLDGDDCWTESAFSIIQELISKETDMCMFSAERVKLNARRKKIVPVTIASGETGSEYLEKQLILGQEFFPYAWLYIYRRSFIEQKGLLFVPGMASSEDFEFNIRALNLAKSIYGTKEVVVLYYEREDSLTSTITTDKMKANIISKVKAFEVLPHAGIADMYVWTVMQISRLKDKNEINQVIDMLKEYSWIEAYAKKKNLVFARNLIKLVGYYNASKIYIILNTLKTKFI